MKPSTASSQPSPVTPGQKEETVRLITDATRKAAESFLGDLVARGAINKESLERVRERGNEVAAAASAAARDKIAELAEDVGGQSKSLFKPILTVTLAASVATPTAECFTDQSQYWGRDGDLDKWLPTTQPAQPEKEFRAQELTDKATFLEMLKNIFNNDGDVASFGKLLISGGHTVALPQIDVLIKREDSGEDVGLKTNGNANFFFVENADGTVSVVRASRFGGQWYVRVARLAHASRWSAEHHVFLRNS